MKKVINDQESNQNCHHPSLKDGGNGEKICANCGRTVYSGSSQNQNQGNNHSSENSQTNNN